MALIVCKSDRKYMGGVVAFPALVWEGSMVNNLVLLVFYGDVTDLYVIYNLEMDAVSPI